MKRKYTVEERINFVCKRNGYNLSQKQYNMLKTLISLYENIDYGYIKTFILNNVDFWPQRIRRLKCLNKGITKYRMFLIYGKHVGLNKWNEYVMKQSITNTFAYKHEKYGWDEQRFREYNLSRSITIDNMIKKYGNDVGREKFEEYRRKQKYSGSSEQYFIDVYGENAGREKFKQVCDMKANTLRNFITRYGNEEGKIRFEQYIQTRKPYYSNISQELFREIKTDNCYYAELNKEFGCYGEDCYYFYDFVDTNLKKCVEFNEDWIHCNPKMYDENYIHTYGYTAKEKWENDNRKIATLVKIGYDVMIVWESEYLNNREQTVNRVKDFLHG